MQIIMALRKNVKIVQAASSTGQAAETPLRPKNAIFWRASRDAQYIIHIWTKKSLLSNNV